MLTTIKQSLPEMSELYTELERNSPGYWICRELLRQAVSAPAATDGILLAAKARMLAETGKSFSLSSADRYLRGEYRPLDADKPHQFIRVRLEKHGWTLRCSNGRVQVVPLDEWEV